MISFIYLLYFRPMPSYLHHHHHLLIIILTQSQYKRVWYPILCHNPKLACTQSQYSSCCLLCKGSTFSIMNPLPPNFIKGLGKGEGNVSYCTSNRNPSPPHTQKIHLKGMGWTKTNTPRLHI